jgi:hypothetical protein
MAQTAKPLEQLLQSESNAAAAQTLELGVELLWCLERYPD